MGALWNSIGMLWRHIERYIVFALSAIFISLRRKAYVIVPATSSSRENMNSSRSLKPFHDLLQREFGRQEHEVSFPDENSNNVGVPQSLLLYETPQMIPVGHVVIQRANNPGNNKMSKQEAERLLRIGVPEGSIRQLAQAKGVDYDELMKEDNAAITTKEEDNLVVSIGALVVEPSHRGLGLGKALAKAAVAWSVDIQAKEVRAHAATEELALWYERMGAKLDRKDKNIIVPAVAKNKHTKSSIKSFRVDITSLRGNSLDENILRLGIPKCVEFRKKVA